MLKRAWPYFLVTIMILSLFVALSLRAYWLRGGPDWAYYCVEIVLGLLSIITGLVVLVGSVISTEFVRKLYTLENKQFRVTKFRRLRMMLSFGLAPILIEILLLVTAYYQWIILKCPAFGC